MSMLLPSYASEKGGDLQLSIDVTIVQRRYWDAYHREIDAFSSEVTRTGGELDAHIL